MKILLNTCTVLKLQFTPVAMVNHINEIWDSHSSYHENPSLLDCTMFTPKQDKNLFLFHHLENVRGSFIF